MSKQTALEEKLAKLPNNPGVYFHKDKQGKIIYVGKAAVLKNRVRQYFQKSRSRDAKTQLMVKEIVDVDWIVTESELDALFLEAELIKRYKTKYNILQRDDKSNQYVRIETKSAHPTVRLTRRPLDDGAEYIGPFLSGDISRALRVLRKIFPFDTKVGTSRVSLDYHIGLSPGLEEGKTTVEHYRKNLGRLRLYLLGKRNRLIKDMEKDMKLASKEKDFEVAAKLRDQIYSLKSLQTKVVFGDKEFIDISKDQALNGLSDLLGLPGAPVRIEGYDISHLSGTNNVASMVVFTYGLPEKKEYRKFKMHKSGNDDFAHMKEVISRRFSPRHLASWPKPDLLLIDGGKGQLSSALEALAEKEVNIPAIGLAKRREQIVVKKDDGFEVIELGLDSNITKLLTRIRDESHRFAISYRSSLSRKQMTKSILEDVPGIGAKTRKTLIRQFGSIKAALEATEAEMALVIGKAKARTIKEYYKDKKA